MNLGYKTNSDFITNSKHKIASDYKTNLGYMANSEFQIINRI